MVASCFAKTGASRSEVSPLAEIVEQAAARMLAGEEVSYSEYALRHPGLAAALHEVWPALAVMAGMSGSGDERFFPVDETSRLRGLVGDFKILREIGRGGMGVVYEAEQLSLSRPVALKILPFAGVLDERQLSRFKNEAQAAASLEHPHIVPVYAVGCERGIHYYAMRFIEGQSLAEVIALLRGATVPLPEGEGRAARKPEYADTIAAAADSTLREPLGPRNFRRVAELGIQAAEALHYAHQRGVVHRDIKPSNLLVDSGGRLWVTDFGLAQIAGGHELTMTGDLVGTLRYMSPEQLAGEQVVDQRTDVYSLGLTLYELLAGRPAFGASARERLVWQILQEDPPPLRQLEPNIPRDLETIVAKAIDKDRDGRYPTARALADDLERFVEHHPIAARRPTVAERAAKWCRRHPAAAWSAAVALAAVALTATMSTLLIDAAYRREIAQHEVAKGLRVEADAERTRAEYARYLAEMRQCPHEWESGRVSRLRQTLLTHLPAPGRPDLRGWEWYYFLSLCHQDLLTLEGHQGPVLAVDWSSDGRQLVSGGQDGAILLWTAADGTKWALTAAGGAPVEDVRWRPGTAQFLSVSRDGVARLWDSRRAQTVREWTVLAGPHEHPRAAAFKPDGSQVALLSFEEPVRVFNANDGQLASVGSLDGQRRGMSDVAWNPDGLELVTGIYGGARLWNAEDGRTAGIAEYPSPGLVDVFDVDFSSDGAWFAAGGYGAQACIWNTHTRKVAHSLQHNGPVDAVAFQPHGKLLATGTRSERVELWDVASGERLTRLRGHTGGVTAFAWNADGSRLASASRDGTIKLWAPEPLSDTLTFSENQAVGPLAWSPDGCRLACGWLDGSIKLLDAETGRIESFLEADPDPRDLSRPAWSPDGKRLAWRHSVKKGDARDREVAVWNVADETRPLMRIEEADAAAWHPRSQWIAVAVGPEAQVWNPRTQQRLAVVTADDTRHIFCVAVSPDGRHLATAGNGGTVSVWETGSWTLERTIRSAETGHWIGVVAWSVDGQRLACGGHDGVIQVWDTRTGAKLVSMEGHAASIAQLDWTRDGRRIVSSSSDQTVRLWDAATGAEVLLLCPSGALHAAWSPDGRRLATAGPAGRGQIWDARKGFEQAGRLVGESNAENRRAQVTGGAF